MAVVSTPPATAQEFGVVEDLFVGRHTISPFGGFGRHQNLLIRSEEFNDNTVWVKSASVTSTTNTIAAPDEATSAEAITFGTAGLDTIKQVSGTAAGNAKFIGSVWLKAASGTPTVRIGVIDQAGTPQGTYANAALTTTWERFQVSHTFSTGTLNAVLILDDNTDASGTLVVHAWGGELESVASGVTKAGVYVKTGASAVSTAAQGLVSNTGVTVPEVSAVNFKGFANFITELPIQFKGTSYSTTLNFANPAGSSKTITLPDVTGNVYVSSGTDVAIADGGTGTSVAPANGKLLIGKTDGTYAVANLTQGANVTITNGDGTIAIAATGGGGNTLDGAYDQGGAGAGGTITVDAANLVLNLADYTNDYKLLVDNTTGGAIAKAMSIETSGVGGTFTTGLDLSDAGLTTALALGTNQITINAITLTAAELSYLDNVSSAIQTQVDGKLGTALTSARVFVGDGSNVAVGVVMSGDVGIDNTGATTIQDNSVDGTDLAVGSDAKGDVLVYDGSNYIRVGVGTNTHVLTADSTTGSGVKWAQLPSGNTLDGAYDQGGVGAGGTITVDAANLVLNLADYTNDYKLLVDNTTGGAIAKALSIETSGVGGTFTTGLDLSDGGLTTALALGTNQITVNAITLTAAELSYLDGASSAIQTQLNGKFDAGGRSLTATGTTVDADAELYTEMKSFVLESPAVADDALVQLKFATAVTITRVSCSTNAGTVTIQFDERGEGTPNTAGTDVMSAALICDSDTQATTSFANAGIAADAVLSMDVDAIATSPGVVRVHVDYTADE